jgi:hypothetical protein
MVRIRRHRLPSRAVRAVTLACALSLLLPLQAIGLTWGSPKSLSIWGQTYLWPGALATTSNSKAHVVFIEGVIGATVVEYRSTTNGGVTWGAPFQISSGAASLASQPSLASSGLALDAAWVQGSTTTSLKLVYRRSLDAGITWQSPLYLTTTGFAQFPRVIRDGAGHVIVTWTDGQSGAIRVRASTNGGHTFGATTTLGTTTNLPSGFTYRQGFPVLALGSGIVYLAYYTSSSALRVRRSTTGGASWTAVATLATNASGFFPGLAASGSTALLGYSLGTSTTQYAVYRRTIDKGGHWSAAVALAPSTPASAEPVLNYSGGSWRAVYERCATTSCTATATYFRSSTNGTSWTSAATIASASGTFMTPGGVASSVKMIVVYDAQYSDGAVEAFSRSGS